MREEKGNWIGQWQDIKVIVETNHRYRIDVDYLKDDLSKARYIYFKNDYRAYNYKSQ